MSDVEKLLMSALEQLREDDNIKEFVSTLKTVVNQKGGVTKLAKETNINRQVLYRIFSFRKPPCLDILMMILGAWGLTIGIKPFKCT